MARFEAVIWVVKRQEWDTRNHRLFDKLGTLVIKHTEVNIYHGPLVCM